MTRAVFFDRDGVLTRAYRSQDGRTHPARQLCDLEILPGALSLTEVLRSVGYQIAIITNQPDVARGVVTRAFADDVARRVAGFLRPDTYEVCYHDDTHGCDCRKPAPGLIVRAVIRRGIDVAQSALIGDRLTDLEAGLRAGIPAGRLFLVKTNDYESLHDAARHIIGG